MYLFGSFRLGLLVVGIERIDEINVIHAYDKCFEEMIVMNDIVDSIPVYKPLIKDILTWTLIE